MSKAAPQAAGGTSGPDTGQALGHLTLLQDGEPTSLLREGDYLVVAKSKVSHGRITLHQVMQTGWRHGPVENAMPSGEAA
jgi:hypothetical protein